MDAQAKSKPMLFSAPMVRALRNGTKTQTRLAIKLVWEKKLPNQWEPEPKSEVCALSGGCTAERWPNGKIWTWDADGNGGENWNENDLSLGESPDELPLIAYRQGFLKPRHLAGEDVWVRETWSTSALCVYPCPNVWYRSDFSDYDDPAKETEHVSGCTGNWADCFACDANKYGRFMWRPSIFMPKKFSRVTLRVTDVRVQRLQDISEDDAIAEGVHAETHGLAAGVINGKAVPLSNPPANEPGEWRHRFAYRLLWESINGQGSWAANPWVFAYTFEVKK